MNFDDLYSLLIDGGYFTEEELRLVTDICGNRVDVLNDCIYSRFGVYEFEDLD